MPKRPFRHAPTNPKSRFYRLMGERLRYNLSKLESEGDHPYYVQAKVPEAWDTIELDIDVEEPKEKITLYVDKSVAKFFKAMGRGYHRRISRILGTYAQMRIMNIKRREEMSLEELGRIQQWMEGREQEGED